MVREENKENIWKCPNCKAVHAYQGDDPPVPCEDCTWNHEKVGPKDVPSVIKYPI